MCKKLLLCLILSLLASQVALGDYVLTLNGGGILRRITDSGETVWETTGLDSNVQPELAPGDDSVIYTAVSSWGARLINQFDAATGTFLGPATVAQNTDRMCDIQWGADYNGDGVDDVWTASRDGLFEVFDGTTFGTVLPDTALNTWDIADVEPYDGTGGRGLLIGPDLTGDGIGELYATKGYNDADDKINVWDPTTMTKVATYPIPECREVMSIILGPDVNGDGQEDLWVASSRNHQIQAYDYTDGTNYGEVDLGVDDLRFPLDVDYGPNGTILIATRFATSLDPDSTGGEVTGGDLLQYDPATRVTTLIYEHTDRIDGVAYITVDIISAANPKPANESTDVSYDTILSWTPGALADKHDVYLGTDFDAVSTASRTDPMGVLMSQGQDANNYDHPVHLEFDQTYYWRIDEVNAAPDNTIHKGDIWSFTVEPIAYQMPAESINATASGQAPDQGPEKTIDGSGLNDNDQHSVSLPDMWLTPMGDTVPVWIQYEFDKPYQLHEMLVWNHNGPSVLSMYGLKDVTVEYSIDGANWTQVPDVSEFAQATGAESYTYNTVVSFNGVAAKYVKITATDNWSDGMFTQYGLSEVRFTHIPTSARSPIPDDGTTDVALDVTLGWSAGREAAEHNVYISTDEQAVINGTVSAVTVSEASYGPLSLDLGSIYYWRVDEVNNAETLTTWKGDVWSFSTQEYLVVEDFEDYNDYPPDEIFSTWIDGYGVETNGSTIGYAEPDFPAGEHFVETTIVHSGEQSMPYFYDNTTAGNSEATRTLDFLTDWTRNGIGTLTLWYIGDAANAVEQIYVILNDSAFVNNDNPNAAQITEWAEWNINLQEFADQGVNLANVNTISIGFGDKNNLQAGGSGMVFFDDIRLYRQIP